MNPKRKVDMRNIQLILRGLLAIGICIAVLVTLEGCSSPTAPVLDYPTTPEQGLQAELNRRRDDGRDMFGVICYSWYRPDGQLQFRCSFVSVGDGD